MKRRIIASTAITSSKNSNPPIVNSKKLITQLIMKITAMEYNTFLILNRILYSYENYVFKFFYMF